MKKITIRIISGFIIVLALIGLFNILSKFITAHGDSQTIDQSILTQMTTAMNNFNSMLIPTKIETIATTTSGSGTLTWTFPIPFISNPVVVTTALDATVGASTNAQVTALSTTSVTIQTSRVQSVLGIIALTSNPAITVEITAQGS